MKNKENLFILIGPTAIGKTDLSIKLAQMMNGEIISADSMQIYKYMNIGSAKVTKEEMQEVPHHLIDNVYPDEDFTVANYKNHATTLISNINKEGRLPIIAGGTGLYINSIVYNLQFTEVPPSESIRNQLELLSNEDLYKELENIDNTSANKLNVNDRKRVIRALEIYKSTGKTMSEYNKDFRMENQDYNLVMIGLNMDRARLYDRINRRVDIMINSGLIDEVKGLLEMGYNKNLVSMQGIGYKEIIMYLEEEISLDESIALIKQKSRNYAKRQLTWFRRDERIKWMNLDDYSNLEKLSKDIIQYTNNKMIRN
jgi:tRNA dimethylallyltransferase